ncbi:MAG TPA: polysaccharide deacetylase family protein [Candidatus Omnitrophota bacterium]|nr:polysaccharide deacetylase family protein [Candidatus Omnitrophota bacterium]
MTQRFKKTFFVILAVLVLVLGSAVLWLPRLYVVPIVMYHQVTFTERPQPNWVSPENFEWQMAYMTDHGYRVIRLGELVEAIKSGKPLPRKTAVITFDDGYANNYTNAFPILKKYGFPATIFVAADKINTEGYLTWDQMKEMLASGIDIGSHTRTEAYLPDLMVERQRNEIQASKDVLEENLGVPVDYFAYPISGFSDEIKEMVKEAGYKAACATNRGHDRFNKDLFELKRVRFSDKDIRKDYLWIKLSGYYNLFRKLKNPY